MQRGPPLTAPPGAPADVLPPPRIATWSKDKFEIVFARTGGTLNPQLEMTVRHLGTHPVFGDGTAKATVVIGPKPLNVQVCSVDATCLTVDLYGDGRKIVRLRDDARMSRPPGGPGRSHVLNTWLDQSNLSSSSLTVFDPKASPADLTVATTEVAGGPAPQRGFAVGVDRAGPQYRELAAELELSLIHI